MSHQRSNPCDEGSFSSPRTAQGGKDELLRFACRTAHAGAEAISALDGGRIAVDEMTTERDLVTDADRRCTAVITELIGDERPEDGLLCEEVQCEWTSRSGLRWVVDPLDGTMNFAYRISHWAVSVGCEQWRDGRWHVLLGVVHDVLREETFTAVRGRGSRLNGAVLTVRDPVDADHALIATELAGSCDSRHRQAKAFTRLASRVRDLRSTGSSALDLCWTAAGRLDGFYEDELHRWDWSAGALIANEAGATAGRLGDGVIVAGPHLYPTLRALVLAEVEESDEQLL